MPVILPFSMSAVLATPYACPAYHAGPGAWLPVRGERAGRWPRVMLYAAPCTVTRRWPMAAPGLQVGVSFLTEDGQVRWIRPPGEEVERPPGCKVVDTDGTTIVPCMVDGHSHLTLPDSPHWIERGADPTKTLVAVAESNGELQHRSGVRWARDIGSPERA